MKADELYENHLIPNSIFDNTKKMAEFIYHDCVNSRSNKIMQYNEYIHFKFYYRNNEGFNACVEHKNNTDFLFMNDGTLLGIQEYMYAVFARSDMFTEIGHSDVEVNKKFLSIYLDKKNEYDYINFPNDNIRREVAELVAMFALRYIVCHEIGHLVNGHVFLLKELTKKFDLHMYSENNNLTNEKISPLNRRTLEADADAFASTRGIHNVMSAYLDSNVYPILSMYAFEKFKLFELWAFATHTIFLFFDVINNFHFSESSLYLPNQIRQIMNMESALVNINDLYKYGFLDGSDKLEDIRIMLLSGVLKAEKYFNFFFDTDFSYISTIDENRKYQYYKKQIRLNWNENIESQLRKYARTILFSENMDEAIEKIRIPFKKQK